MRLCLRIAGLIWPSDEPAQQGYESAAAFQPDKTDGWVGLCRIKLSEGDFVAARHIYETQIPNFPDSRDALRIAGLVEFFARDFSKAGEFYTRLASDDPTGGIRGGILWHA